MMRKSFVGAVAVTAVNAVMYEKLTNLMSLQQVDYQKTDQSFSSLSMEVDGVAKNYFIAAPFTTAGGQDYVVPSNGRGYISETATLDRSNPAYFRPNLLGGFVEYDVDLSDHQCGCIAAFYLVSMPGKGEDGNVWMDTDGWGYCDANQVDGNWCPEFDIMEANKWAWATTPHKCDAPTDKGFYWHCDQGGQCAQNSTEQLEWSGYGPGDNYEINTERPFHAKIEFNNDNNNQFSTFTTTFTQDDRTESMTADCSYLNNMTNDIADGMGFVISNWGGDASWLWKDRCDGHCNWPELTISNIKIKTGTVVPGPSPGPSPYRPSDYAFGDNCAGIFDFCGDEGCDVNDCRWSWPQDDPHVWNSDHAGCRCDISDTEHH